MANETYVNADGLVIKNPAYYARRGNFVNRATDLVTFGAKKQVELDIDLKHLGANGVSFSVDLNNDGTRDGFHKGDVYIPAHSSILNVILVMGEAAAGGTSIKVGTFTEAGAAIDDDGLITTTEGVLANMNAAGKRVYGAGAYTSATAGTAGVGAADAYIGVTAAGTFTAGKGRLIIEYLDPIADAA